MPLPQEGQLRFFSVVGKGFHRHMEIKGSERNIHMRFLVTAAICLGIVLPLSAEAQTSRLPRKSTSERQVDDINRNIQQERRLNNLEQQIQVDRNQLRQNIDRHNLFSNTPSPFRNCPVGAAGC